MKKYLIISFSLLIIVFSSSRAFSQISQCYNWDALVYGYSELLHDDQALLVSGVAGTEIVVFDYTPSYCDHDFDAWVYSELANSSGVLSRGRLESNGWTVDGQHGVFNAQYRDYCVTSAHGLVDYWSYFNGKIFQIFTQEYTAGYTQECYLFAPSPTPTPTPGCNPFSEGALPPCPLLSVTIGDVPLIEKHGERNVNVTVSGLVGTTEVIFKLRPIVGGTGEARFDNNTTEIRKGNGNYTLTIRGITESSAANSLTIEATTTANTTNVLNHKEFTVAVITSLVFERINSDDVPLDDNPGTDGVVNPDGSEGRRIFPDRNTPTDGTDRSVLRVKATISPTGVPNAKVYFASFDLDDPSATGPPIDTTPSDGNDNNGAVNNSRSGELLNPTGGTCVLPTIANHVSKIECTVGTGKGVSANYRVAMQPGDNFTVAASLVEPYRDQIQLNANVGDNLVNTANQTILISGEANPNNVQGIRTRMLTNWRKLHIEVDSMGQVTQNRAIGTIMTTTRIRVGQTMVVPLNPTTPTTLEPNRFEGGRLVSNSRSLSVTCNIAIGETCNTASSVTVRNNGGSTITLLADTPFQLYDDDDMDDEDVGNLNGDEGDDVPEPPDSLVEFTDTPCSSTLTIGCNTFAPAYVKPIYDLAGSHENTGFNTNINTSVDPLGTVAVPPTEIQAWFNFNNVTTESNSDFWTIYTKGIYQYDVRSDHDPSTDSGVLGTVDQINGQGILIFSETTRLTEIPSAGSRPVGRNYTHVHEIGHLFYGLHGDGGLMSQTVTRTIGTFDDRTLNKIRGGEFIDILGLTRRITHP